jgi:hypothetical protein
VLFRKFDLHNDGKFSYVDFLRAVIPQGTKSVDRETWMYVESLRKVIKKRLNEKGQDLYSVYSHFTGGSKPTDVIPSYSQLMDKMKMLGMLNITSDIAKRCV